jgi:regulator of protease activity HflC (stomatin/prohibitin superfamily)
VREVVLGPDEDDDEEERQALKQHRAILLTRSHAEFFILVARPQSATDGGEAPVDILEARIPIHFVVTDPVAFAQRSAAPERLLKVLGESELAKLGCSSGAFALLAEKSGEAVVELEQRIQASADAHGLGVKVLDVNIADFHPPIEVQKAFRAETAAIEDRESERLKQLAYAARRRPETEGLALAELEQARSYAMRKKLLATADAERFGALRALDRASPHAFRALRLLRGLEEAYSGPQRRVILARGEAGSVDIDLGEKISADDLGVGEGGGK